MDDIILANISGDTAVVAGKPTTLTIKTTDFWGADCYSELMNIKPLIKGT